MADKTILRGLAAITTLVYLCYYLYERKTIEDERERYIELKAADAQQWGSTVGLVVLTAFYVYRPTMDAIYPLMTFALSSAYVYIIAKLYYRRTM